MPKWIRGSEVRTTDLLIDALFIDRWSPRAMSGEELTHEELMTLFEAARWAPSSYNAQPWKFFYATRRSEHWPAFFRLMVEFNQSWTKNAAALVVVTSRTVFEHNGKPAQTHSFDAGSAFMSLALQGWIKGLVVHAMQGFDYNMARSTLNLPEEFQVEAMIAIGKPGDPSVLDDATRGRETPSQRKSLAEIVHEGPLLDA